MELFGTAGIRGDAATEVTPELALSVGRAVGRDGDEFVLACDGRTSGPALADAVAAGLRSAGATVFEAGRLPTPALAFASRDRRGVMVTASHNPPADNGIKLFVDGEEYDRDAERRVSERVAAEAGPVDARDWGAGRRIDPLADYRDHVVAYAAGVGAAPADVTVAVDCGNGMAGLATPQVLSAVGADVRALEANVDGRFPARGSKPTAATLTDLRRFVADTGATMGLAHDGDADRIVVVDADGEVVHEDTVVAILAERYVRASDVADPVVVTTPNASDRIDERVAAAGGRVERVRLGALHEGVAEYGGGADDGSDADEGDADGSGGSDTAVVFAAEPWKHMHTASGPWIDGVASAAVLTRLVAEHGLETLREPVTERPYLKESVDCPDDRKEAAMDRLGTTLPDRFPEAEVDTEHGVRLSLPDGSWVLVRPSGTEPYLRVYAESERVEDLTAAAVATVEDAVASG